MKKIIIMINALVICLPSLYSQQKDFGLWTSFELEKKISKRIELDAGIANRLEDNLNQRDESFADIGISYRKDVFAADFGYRFTNNNEPEKDYSISHRYIWQLRYRPDWERFSFDYRLRFQSHYFSINSSKNGKIPENYLRNRLQVSYNTGKSDIDPFASYEYFFRLNQIGPNQFERRRLTLGLEYAINNDNSIGIAWLFHETYNITDPKKLYVIALEYKVEI